MDRAKLQAVRERLQYVDESRSHLVRPRTGGSLVRPAAEDLERRLRELAEYTLELKNIMSELLEALEDD